MENKIKTKRIDGYLHKVITVKGDDNKDHTVVVPFSVEFRPRDLLQTIVGATIIATPVSFTEEVWNLGKDLPFINVIFISLISILFLSIFIYFNFYRFHFRKNVINYLKRVFLTYLSAFIVCFILLFLINKVDLNNFLFTGLNRVLLVTFPASMSACISDTLK